VKLQLTRGVADSVAGDATAETKKQSDFKEHSNGQEPSPNALAAVAVTHSPKAEIPFHDDAEVTEAAAFSLLAVTKTSPG
jgi:hypothetical protein